MDDKKLGLLIIVIALVALFAFNFELITGHVVKAEFETPIGRATMEIDSEEKGIIYGGYLVWIISVLVLCGALIYWINRKYPKKINKNEKANNPD